VHADRHHAVDQADQPAHGAVGVRDTAAVRPPATGADRALEPHAGPAHRRRDRRGLKLDLTAAGQPNPQRAENANWS
jgi:hypothetical protein